MKAIKPYYKRGNKYFYKSGKKKMTITRTDIGAYVFDGDVIAGNIQFPIITAGNDIKNIRVRIKVYR